jgi:putative SOS response-associated peptidase YedK
MCGRYDLLSSPRELAGLFQLAGVPELAPRYNIAPSQQVPIVRVADAGRELALLRWGFRPGWGKPGMPTPINAMSETAAVKPMFRSAFRSRRCLIPATAFYEWQATRKKRKQPFRILMADDRPFAFAGLWEGESCCILTTGPNELMKPIHDRMPVIVDPRRYALWIDPDADDAEALADVLRPCPAERMRAYAVSTWVNDPRHDDPRCIEPAA